MKTINWILTCASVGLVAAIAVMRRDDVCVLILCASLLISGATKVVLKSRNVRSM